MLSQLRVYGGLATLVAFAVLWALYKGEQRHSRKLSERVVELTAKLDRLADESEARQKETARRVAESNERIVYVDRIAREIEKAPLPGQCKTPDAVMGADL